jgi:hypothetical protein
MTSPSDQPAFPTLADNGHLMTQDGMTLRDYFAAKAMQALIQRDERDIAWEAYRFADEMLKARDASQ